MKSKDNIFIRVLRTVAFTIIYIVMLILMLFGQLGIILYFCIGRTTDSKRLAYHRFLYGFSRWLLMHIPGVKVRMVDFDDKAFDEPSIVVCNHQSHLDLLCMLALSPKVVFVAKKWVWRNPLYGIAIRYAECISTEESFEKNIERIDDLRRRGYSTVIFPEGTRSASCRLLRFRRGAFFVAQKLKMDVLPIVFHGTGIVMNKKSFAISPGTITIKMLPKIPFDSAPDHIGLAKETKSIFEKEYSELENQYDNKN